MHDAKPDDDMRVYYARRAREYERIYAKPERQTDLARLHELLPALFDARRVLEIACGTGYWTELVAGRALAVHATDINEEVLELARHKRYPPGRVTFARFDVYAGEALAQRFDGGLAAFWWSHVPAERMEEFLGAFHRHLDPGARVVFLDNNYVSGSSTPISRRDEQGNSYQLRGLDDGARYEVVKNFPRRERLVEQLAGVGDEVEYRELEYFWYASYRLRGGPG